MLIIHTIKLTRHHKTELSNIQKKPPFQDPTFRHWKYEDRKKLVYQISLSNKYYRYFFSRIYVIWLKLSYIHTNSYKIETQVKNVKQSGRPKSVINEKSLNWQKWDSKCKPSCQKKNSSSIFLIFKKIYIKRSGKFMRGGSLMFWMMNNIKSGCKFLQNYWSWATDVYIVTLDVWLQFYEPERKQVNKIWLTKLSNEPTIARRGKQQNRFCT